MASKVLEIYKNALPSYGNATFHQESQYARNSLEEVLLLEEEDSMLLVTVIHGINHDLLV